jgi:hypothetical protein
LSAPPRRRISQALQSDLAFSGEFRGISRRGVTGLTVKLRELSEDLMLAYRFTPTSTLTPADLTELWSVYSHTFFAERAQFDAGVRAADEVVLYRKENRLVGLGLVRSFTERLAGRVIRVVWTGSVVLAPEFRGQNVIQRSAVARLALERVRHPLVPLYWFFDTFSYKSYLLMARNFRDFWPRPEQPTPAWEAEVLAALCARQHGALYDASRGVVGARGKQLRPGVAELPRRSADPHLAFFAQVNPGAAQGECLACLAPLDAPNLTHLVARMAQRALRPSRRRQPRAVRG